VKRGPFAFDLDGTLMDHRRAAREAVTLWAAGHGWASSEDPADLWFRLERQYFSQYVSGEVSFLEQRRRRLRAFLPLVGMAAHEHHLDAVFAEYLEFYATRWVAFDDAAPTLAALDAAGFSLAVLTNGQQEQQLRKLAAIGLVEHFDVVLASGELAAPKPDPRAFRALCDALGYAPSAITFVGDDLDADVVGAKAAGLIAVHLDREGSGGTPAGVRRIRSLDKMIQDADEAC
jgi:putative hydrolase of the HAD superfamily